MERVVYSTCAVSWEENEAVVANVLETHPGWRTVPVIESWPRRGLDHTHYQDHTHYLRADPDLDLCNGFFVAVLEKENRSKFKKKTKKQKKKGC